MQRAVQGVLPFCEGCSVHKVEQKSLPWPLPFANKKRSNIANKTENCGKQIKKNCVVNKVKKRKQNKTRKERGETRLDRPISDEFDKIFCYSSFVIKTKNIK